MKWVKSHSVELPLQISIIIIIILYYYLGQIPQQATPWQLVLQRKVPSSKCFSIIVL